MTTSDDLRSVGMSRGRMIGLIDAALRSPDLTRSLRTSARRFVRQGRAGDGNLADDMAFAAEFGGRAALVRWREALVTSGDPTRAAPEPIRGR